MTNLLGPDAHGGFEALQQLIAARHHVLLGRDDPIAMLQTVNELLVAQTAAALEQTQRALVAQFCQELEVSTAGWKQETKALGERTLETARQISADQIAHATQALLVALAAERARTRSTIKRAALMNALILALLITCTVGSLWLR